MKANRSRTRGRTRKLTIALGWLAVALAVAPAAAQAGPLVASAPNCTSQALSQPFLPWLDPAHYTLAPNGGFENRASGWTLTGKASVVSGNETFYVRSRSDTRSLKLPAGSSATSSSICVGIEYPTLRLFARNAGAASSTLRVEVLFEDAAGNVLSAPIGTLTAGTSWQPTVPMVIGANLLPLLPDSKTPVAFRFTPQGSGGDWRIDDVYVDPYRRS
jgi:hypothetical protein